jgi:hypothetical protein
MNPVQGPVPQPGEEDGEDQHQHTPRLGGRELCPPGKAQQQLSVLRIGTASRLILNSIFNYCTVPVFLTQTLGKHAEIVLVSDT